MKQFLGIESALLAFWTAVVGWVALLIVVSILSYRSADRSVTQNYRASALAWLAGEELYKTTGDGFLYLPSSAVAYIPFAVLPRPTSDVLWRCLSVGLFAVSSYQLCQLRMPGRSAELFFLTSVVSVPLAYSMSRNGQMTELMTACMILSMVSIAEKRWSLAAGFLAVAFALKPLVLVLILLVAAFYHPMRWRLLVGLLLVMLFPFATQKPGYVIEQYTQCWQMLRVASDVGKVTAWSQFFWLLKSGGLGIPDAWQTPVRLVFAVVTLGLVRYGSRNSDPPHRAIFILTLSICYLLLFNPRTEHNTYGMIGPVLGLSFAVCCLSTRRPASAVFLGVISMMILCAYELGKVMTPDDRTIWMAPLGCALFTGWFVWDSMVSRENGNRKSERLAEVQSMG